MFRNSGSAKGGRKEKLALPAGKKVESLHGGEGSVGINTEKTGSEKESRPQKVQFGQGRPPRGGNASPSLFGGGGSEKIRAMHRGGEGTGVRNPVEGKKKKKNPVSDRTPGG